MQLPIVPPRSAPQGAPACWRCSSPPWGACSGGAPRQTWRTSLGCHPRCGDAAWPTRALHSSHSMRQVQAELPPG